MHKYSWISRLYLHLYLLPHRYLGLRNKLFKQQKLPFYIFCSQFLFHDRTGVPWLVVQHGVTSSYPAHSSVIGGLPNTIFVPDIHMYPLFSQYTRHTESCGGEIVGQKMFIFVYVHIPMLWYVCNITMLSSRASMATQHKMQEAYNCNKRRWPDNSLVTFCFCIIMIIYVLTNKSISKFLHWHSPDKINYTCFLTFITIMITTPKRAPIIHYQNTDIMIYCLSYHMILASQNISMPTHTVHTVWLHLSYEHGNKDLYLYNNSLCMQATYNKWLHCEYLLLGYIWLEDPIHLKALLSALVQYVEDGIVVLIVCDDVSSFGGCAIFFNGWPHPTEHTDVTWPQS